MGIFHYIVIYPTAIFSWVGIGGRGGEEAVLVMGWGWGGAEKNFSLAVSDVKSFENVDGRYISGAFSLDKLLIGTMLLLGCNHRNGQSQRN